MVNEVVLWYLQALEWDLTQLQWCLPLSSKPMQKGMWRNNGKEFRHFLLSSKHNGKKADVYVSLKVLLC